MIDKRYRELSPIAIGGVGGSGTRLIAEFLKVLGYNIGSDLNDANDNLWFTLLFKRLEILSAREEDFVDLMDVFLAGMTASVVFSDQQVQLLKSLATADRPQHSMLWLEQRAKLLLEKNKLPIQLDRLAWKEPNTHIVITRLQKLLPKLKYIHVMRNGLDVAYSQNQNQRKLWGEAYLGRGCNEVTPSNSLQYWVEVHLKILKNSGNNVLLLNFDELCLSPSIGIRKVVDFLGMELSPLRLKYLESLVVPPVSMGRFRQYSLDVFDTKDLKVVEELGFSVR